jgi:hypothetical protein
MKNILTTTIILISLNLFSQNETLEVKEKNSIFNVTKVEENHVLVNEFFEKLNFQIFDEVTLFEKLKEYPIAEKKFVLKQKTPVFFSEMIEKNLKYDKKSSLNQNLLLEINESFIENVIVKLFIEEDNIQEIISNDPRNYGDRNIELYRNFSDLENKLLISFMLDKNKSIQIGNNIIPYLNKLQKTDVEKTLNTSLNLLAVNF